MTREQFVKDFGKALDIERLTDLYVRAGMLKLDEPKSAEQRFYDVVATELAVDSPAMRNLRDNKLATAMIFYNALDEAGLRIVEK